jgi:hypothetical protein
LEGAKSTKNDPEFLEYGIIKMLKESVVTHPDTTASKITSYVLPQMWAIFLVTAG